MTGALMDQSVDREGGPRPEPSKPLRFVVRMEGLPVGTFADCDGLPCGGDFSYGLAGTVRLSRPVDSDSVVLASWIAAMDRPPRCTATITAYDGRGRPLQAWRLRDAWPVRYVGPRLGVRRAVETLELAHSGVLRALP